MTNPDADDALSGLAPLLRVRPELTDFCRFGGAWASSHRAEPAGWAYFHIVTKGSVKLDRAGFGPLRLDAGDILLLPHGDAHTVRAPGAAGHGGPPAATHYRNSLRVQASIGVEPDTELICGRLHFEAAPQNLIVAALPDVVVLRVGERPLAPPNHARHPGRAGRRPPWRSRHREGPGECAVRDDAPRPS